MPADLPSASGLRNLRLTLEYLGTRYAGFQRQADELTVQAEVEQALAGLTGHPVTAVGAGRTDAGVHAEAQVVNFQTTSRLEPSEFCRALNAHLPEDIAAVDVAEEPPDFHARRSALWRRYRYQIYNRSTPSPFHAATCHWVARPFEIGAVARASRILHGTHDFAAFTTLEAAAKGSTLRTVESLAWERWGPLVLMRVQADAFLHHMVRLLVGTLVEVGLGRRAPGSIEEILRQGDRSLVANKAPAQGLILEAVGYHGWDSAGARGVRVRD